MNRNATPDSCSRRSRSNSRCDLRAVELRGRLVQDDELRPERQRAGDLHHLPLLHGQRRRRPRPGPRRSRTRPADRRPGPRSAFQLIRRSPSACRFRNRFSATDSVGMIVDFWYTHATRACHAARSDSRRRGLAVEQDPPGVRPGQPGQHATPAWTCRRRCGRPARAPRRARRRCRRRSGRAVAPKLLDTASAVATGRPVVPAALRSCVVIGGSLAHLVAPQGRVVDVRRRHQRRGQLVLQPVGQLDDGRAVVGRAGGEGLALGGGLGVEEPVLGVQVGRLRDGRVDLAGLDGLRTPRDAVVGDDEDVPGVGRRDQQVLLLEQGQRRRQERRRRPACRCR